MANMKIIEQIWFNLKQIRFKETKAYLDGLTDKYGWSYKNMAFSFCTGSTEKAFKMFPMLKKYDRSLPYRSIISSMDDNTLYVDKNDENELCRIITKVPNPINFGFINVYLDNIDWYGESKESLPAHFFEGIPYELYGNNIRMRKEFDYGNKFNPVCITIDRSTDTGELREYPIGFTNFLTEMGKPHAKDIFCIFPEVQKEVFENKKKKLSAELKNKYTIESKDLIAKDGEEYIMARSQSLSGFSPKAIFTKEAKVHGYMCKKISHRTVYAKTNEHNHMFCVDITVPPFTKLSFAELEIKGNNFNITVPLCDNDILLDCEETAREYAKRVFDIADRVIGDVENTVYESFGNTPKWYIDNL